MSHVFSRRKLPVFLLSLLLCLSAAGCAETARSDAPEAPAAQVSYASAVVSYLGPEGTYTQEACGRFFEKEGSYLPCATVNDAVEALIAGESDFAVIPQENTIGGAVIDYVDTLLAQDAVSVVGEVELPISQNLLALPGAEIGDVKTVYSHKQGIAQGRAWLAEHLPDAAVVEVSSTAEGAKMVAEGGDRSCAAIASAACADVYALNILAPGIQNNDSNKTRFYVLSLDAPATTASDRLAFVATGKAADLPALMSEIARQKMTLVALHDRPRKTELGEYHYLIECSGGSYGAYQTLTEKCPFAFRYLGSFAVR